MLDNISGYSVDKAKFVLECTPREAAARTEDWEAIYGTGRGPQGGKLYNHGSLKRGEAEGTYLYFWDVWGEEATSIDELPFEEWYALIDRIDLKLPMPMTPDGRDNYHDYLKEKIGDNRSVRLMDSPPRQKRGQRDAGGHSLALGSHKSDYRVHWTLRTNEDGYQEFQLEGSRLRAVTEFQRLVAGQHANYKDKRGWLPMFQQLLMNASLELSDIDGLYDSDRAEILSGNLDVHGVLERKLQYLEHMVNRLPKSAMHGLYRALEEKLFGIPADPQESERDMARDEGVKEGEV